jgi:uncharacterized protein
MNPSVILILSIVIIIALILFRINVGYAILAGSIFLTLLALPIATVPSALLKVLIDNQTVTLLIVVPCAMAMSSIMEQKGMLSRLASTMEIIGPKISIHAIPAIIGLVPMPAGAVVAATAVKDLADRLKLKPEQITYINYWFRHIWECCLPNYPYIIVTSAVLAIPLITITLSMLPMALLMILTGIITSFLIFRGSPGIHGTAGSSALFFIGNIAVAAWPILMLIILIFLQIDSRIVFSATLFLVILLTRQTWQELKKALIYALNPRILILLYGVMLYQSTIVSSGSGAVLLKDMQNIGMPPVVLITGLPLLINFTTGYGASAAGIAFPLLLPYIVTGSGVQYGPLVLAIVSGNVGQLMSPAHLCLVLSVEYFRAKLSRVYRYLVPLCLILETAAIIIYFVFNFLSR